MYDVAIVGGGPAGYVAAIRAAQLGGSVALIERDRLGGTCLNRGCIPTKSMVRSAELYELAQRMDKFGVRLDGDIHLDFDGVNARKEDVVATLVGGVSQLMKANKVDVLEGAAQVEAPGRILVHPRKAGRTGGSSEGEGGQGGEPQRVEARHVVIATGSAPALPPIPGADLPGVMDSDALLQVDRIPKSLVIVGGGVIGAEFASIYAAFGTEVTVVEALPAFLPVADEEISRRMGVSLRRRGMALRTGVRVREIVKAAGEEGPFGRPKTVRVESDSGAEELTAEVVLIAVGRRPVTDGLGLDAVGIETERGAVVVDDRMATNRDGFWAAGDVNAKVMLAHAAFRQGVVAVENIFGKAATWDGHKVPSGVYTSPEVAWVGLSESEAKRAGATVATSRFPFSAVARAGLGGESEGMAKIVAEPADPPEEARVLGVHIMGPQATELIHEGVVAVQSGLTVGDLAHAIHAHPTLSEVVGEAAEAFLGHPLHMVKRGR